MAHKEALKARFDELAAKWRQETRFESAPSRWAMHWSYQQIIGMGQPVVALGLQTRKEDSEHAAFANNQYHRRRVHLLGGC